VQHVPRILKLAGTTDLQAANCADHGKWRGSRGYFVSRKAVVLLLIAYVCSLVATGLLVYYCVPRFSSTRPTATDTNVESIRTTSRVTLPSYRTRSSNRLPTYIIPTHYRWVVIMFRYQSSPETLCRCFGISDSFSMISNVTTESETSRGRYRYWREDEQFFWLRQRISKPWTRDIKLHTGIFIWIHLAPKYWYIRLWISLCKSIKFLPLPCSVSFFFFWATALNKCVFYTSYACKFENLDFLKTKSVHTVLKGVQCFNSHSFTMQ